MSKTFQIGQKIRYDLGANGWAFAPEMATVEAVNQNGTFNIKLENGRQIKGVRPCVLFAIEGLTDAEYAGAKRNLLSAYAIGGRSLVRTAIQCLINAGLPEAEVYALDSELCEARAYRGR